MAVKGKEVKSTADPDIKGRKHMGREEKGEKEQGHGTQKDQSLRG